MGPHLILREPRAAALLPGLAAGSCFGSCSLRDGTRLAPLPRPAWPPGSYLLPRLWGNSPGPAPRTSGCEARGAQEYGQCGQSRGEKGTGERRWGVGAVYLHTTWSHSSFSVLWPEPFGGDSDVFLGTAWPSERDIWWPRGIMRGQHLGREVPREYPAPWQWHSSVLQPDLGPPRSRYPGKTRAPGMGAKDYGWGSRLGKDGFRVLGHNPDGVRSR